MTTESIERPPAQIPAQAGIGLRAEHYKEVIGSQPPIGWLEVHSENYFGQGGKPLHYLEQARQLYPISLHGVGLSIGSTDPLNKAHLDHLNRLIHRIEPGLVSEHLSWSSVDGKYFNDLLPLPYTEEALKHFSTRVHQVQDILQQQILIENPSSYLSYSHSTIAEWDFMNAIVENTACGILLDVNNVYVSAVNHGFDARHYLRAITADAVQEIHLAGFTIDIIGGQDILIDTHNKPICDEVWALYQVAIERLGAIPSLIEWDSDLPPLDFLVEEASRAQTIMDECHALVA
ncbi:MAG TPA: DUF692 domain-containing protein [Acidiferrobacteraceae bacterium]|nr:DUF692 domain-containing protein [Acidiferrobacteraceae bacterium]